ncbi:MAG: hypothetical protein COA42_23160 [Alteromonadaceae bacterium]|nr:MAG: hypothetical protein COA42_23160 [Alteromonadaceae bacterium]
MDISASRHIAFAAQPTQPPVNRQSATQNQDKLKNSDPLDKNQAGLKTPTQADTQSTDAAQQNTRPNTVQRSDAPIANANQTRREPNPEQRAAQSGTLLAKGEPEELLPFVIEQSTPKSTRAFLEVANQRDQFSIIDIYI